MKVYVGNLSKDMTEAQFSDMVGKFGQTASANLAKDRDTGASRGFGFVEYPNDEHARAAIAALNGKEVGGRVLKVNESQPKGSR
ncbi:MAG TPA: RNA-binding protein [Thermoanaerobaculia bacterium]|nr:RNA-binding protein [Thermoanaerobaculia bacterium]